MTHYPWYLHVVGHPKGQELIKRIMYVSVFNKMNNLHDPVVLTILDSLLLHCL